MSIHRIAIAAWVIAAWAIGCGESSPEQLVIQTVSEENPTIPVVGVMVQVDDEVFVATDSEGLVGFPLRDGPYTVRVFQSERGQVSGARFDDVWQLVDQRDNPLVIAVDGSFVVDRECLVSGRVTGGSGGEGTQVFVHGIAERVPVAPDGTFELLQGRTPSPLELHAFETGGEAPPFRFIGHASASVRLETGSSCDVSDVVLTLGAVSESTVAGVVTARAGLVEADVRAFVGLEFDDSGMLLPALTSQDLTLSDLTATFEHVVPRVAGARARVDISAFLPAGEGGRGAISQASLAVGLPASGLELDLQTPVDLVAPDDDGTVALDGVFEWTEADIPARYSLGARCRAPESGSGPGHSVNFRAVETTVTRAVLPEIPGLEREAGWTCNWSVTWSPIDDASSDIVGVRPTSSATTAERSVTFE